MKLEAVCLLVALSLMECFQSECENQLEHRASMNTFGLDKEINVPLNVPVEHVP